MRKRVTVRSVLHTKVMTLNTTGKTFTFAGSGNINTLPGFKLLNVKYSACFQVRTLVVVQP